MPFHPSSVPEAQPRTGGCYQSKLRSPVFLGAQLLRDLFQRSAYAPHPTLGRMREGSGLSFSARRSSSASGDPSRLLSAVVGNKIPHSTGGSSGKNPAGCRAGSRKRKLPRGPFLRDPEGIN